MKKYIVQLVFVICLILIFLTKSNSQSLTLADSFNGTSDDGSYDLITDANGNIYSIGWYSGIFDTDPGPAVLNKYSSGGRDIYVSKLDSAGNLIWCIGMGGNGDDEGYTITLDSLGDVIIGGRFSSVFDADPSPSGTTFLFNSSSHDIFFAKYSENGLFVWAKYLSSYSNYDDVEDLITDADNNIYLAGSFQGTLDFDPSSSTYFRNGQHDEAYVAKYSSAGNFIWARTFGSIGPDDVTSIKWDAHGFLYCAGYFSNYCTFNSNPVFYYLTSAGLTDAFVAKLDTSGTIQWVKKYGSVGNDAAYGLGYKDDFIVVTGMFEGSVDFNTGIDTFQLTSNGLSDIFNLRMNSDGDFLSANKSGGTAIDYGMDIQIGANHQILTVGLVTNYATFGTGLRAKSLAGIGNRDICVALYDSNLLLNNVFLIGSTGLENSRTVHWSSANEFFVNGFFSMIVDVDPKAIGIYNLISAGSSDVFFAKYKLNCAPLDSSYQIIGSTTLCENVTASFTLSNIYNEYYFAGWNIPSSWTVVSQSKDSITVIVSDSSGMIEYRYVDYCNEERILALSVSVLKNSVISIRDSICLGSVYVFPDGSLGTSDTIQLSVFAAQNGCDSLVYTDLKVNLSVSIVDTVELCYGSQYLFNGIIQSSSGVYSYTVSTPGFCDSTFVLDLSILPANLTLQTKAMCEGDTLWVGPTHHISAGVFIDTLTSAQLCDSIVISNVSFTIIDTSIFVSGNLYSSNQNNAFYQWHECGLVLSPVANAIGQSYSAPVSGSYAVVINLNGCIDTSACVQVQTTSISELGSIVSLFSVIPNPIIDNLTIVSAVLLDEIEIWSVDGKRVLSDKINSNRCSYYLGNWAAGFYFVEIKSYGRIERKKILLL
jgi:Secretion system C-terminal sorting domain